MLSKVLPLRRAQAEVEQRKYDALPAAERANYALPLQPLKLIIMSATMRVNDFQNPVLFPVAIPPIIKVEARQYPVTTHFSKRTEVKNYLKETHKKVCQIHRKLPEGGVLVFLSGKQEILYMCHKLARSLNKKVKGSAAVGTEAGAAEADAAAGPTPAESLTAVDAVGLGASAEELMELEEDAQLLHLQERAADGEEGEAADRAGKNGKKRGGKGKRGTSASVRELLGQDEIDSDSDDEGQDGHSSDDAADSDDDSDAGRPNTTGAADTAPPVSEEEALFILDGDEDSHRRPAPSAAQDMKSKIASTKKGFTTGDSVRDQLLKEALGISADAAMEEEGAEEKQDADGAAAAKISAAADAEIEEPEAPALRAWILPLYALMPAAQQNRVFLPPPPGHRLIVVATNVAETSITIPGIRYVVDSGRQKEKVLTSATPPVEGEEVPSGGKRSFEGTKVIANDAVSVVSGAVGAGIAKYEVRWVAQAGAEQRKGRAGRTGPGHCYRLYSANFYHQYLQPYQPPEITVTPLEELILQVNRAFY
jgi:ATP-dependent RNA helicase DHX37/DHR1